MQTNRTTFEDNDNRVAMVITSSFIGLVPDPDTTLKKKKILIVKNCPVKLLKMTVNQTSKLLE